MSLLSALNVDLVSQRTKGSAHSKEHIGRINKDASTKEPVQHSLFNRDVSYSPATQRAQRILSVELSVSLSAHFGFSFANSAAAESSVHISPYVTSGGHNAISELTGDTVTANLTYDVLGQTADENRSLDSTDSDTLLDTNAIVTQVVGFVAERIETKRAEGASEEQIAFLADQAKQGVEDGIEEAKNVLASLSELNSQLDEQLSGLRQTIHDQIDELSGVVDLLDEQSVSVQDSGGSEEQSANNQATNNQATNNQETEYSTEVPQFLQGDHVNGRGRFSGVQQRLSAHRSDAFHLEVVTKEGDKVTLSIQQNYRYDYKAHSSRNEAHYKTDLSAHSHLMYVVDGDLNDHEVRALDQLFQQVNELADQFYSGDVASAFENAFALRLDASELSSMHLTLETRQAMQMKNAYRSVGRGEGMSTVAHSIAQPLMHYLDQVEAAKHSLSELRDATAIEHIEHYLKELMPEAVAQHPENHSDVINSSTLREFFS